MTAPTAAPVDLPEGFGPDPSHTESDPQAPKVNQDKPPRVTKRRGFNLGTNQKARSGVRSLSDADKPLLRTWYEGIATASDFVRPSLAMAIRGEGQIDRCVDAWFVLAEKNDKVRRWILGVVEGGGWGQVLMAHLPLFIAVLPAQFVEQVLMARMGAVFGQQDEPQMPFAPMYPADVQRDPNQP